MPRKPIVYTSDHPYHIMARSNNRDWFDLPLCYCFGVYTKVISTVIERYQFKLHAFVLMDNHFHMIISTPQSNISSGMRYFMTETARGIRVKSKRINHVYGGRYKPCLITTSQYYASCVKYVYRNPVQAGLAKGVEDYPWSTISSEKRRIQHLVTSPLTGHDALLSSTIGDQLKWYNEPLLERETVGIKQALRKREFKLSQQKNTGKRIALRSPT